MDNLIAELERRLAEQEAQFQAWLAALPDERREEYRKLKIYGGEYSDKSVEFHLKKCYRILDKIGMMKNDRDEAVIPVGLAVQGSTPTVYVDLPGQEKPFENKDEVREYGPEKGKSRRFKATFDTNPFGVPSERKHLGGSMYSADWTLLSD